MELLGLGNMNGSGSQGGVNRSQNQAPKEKSIYPLGDETGAKIYTGGLMVRLGTPLNEVKRLYIEDALSRYRNRSEAAKALDLKETELDRKLRRYKSGS